MIPDIALWRAVVLQALDDALIPPDAKGEKGLWRQQARSWLGMHVKDFRLVCEYADANPQAVLRELERREHATPA